MVPAVRAVLFTLGALACLSGLVSPPLALALGIVLALVLEPPFPAVTHRVSKVLLQVSVVGLGFGMKLSAVADAGRTGLIFTAATVGGALALGWALGRLLRVEATTSCLVSTGTAICGGSAIAAVGGVLGAGREVMSVSLATVFVLNAVALFLFPPLGHYLGLDQEQFGIWSAIAIHDTSSVVGAAARYGEEALQIATTVKLTRALAIAPLALGIALVTRRKGAKVALPWFILAFLLAATVRTAWPGGAGAYPLIARAARSGLTLTLFLIGSGLSLAAVRGVGVRVLGQGIVLWAVVSAVGLAAVRGMLGG